MSLLDLLTQNGSKYSKYDGASPPTNLLATKQSPMHVDPLTTKPGYSVVGDIATTAKETVKAWNEYDDGQLNPLPPHSLLDLEGIQPPRYEDNTPEGVGLRG